MTSYEAERAVEVEKVSEMSYEESEQLKRLMKPSQFRREYPMLFPTDGALWHHLHRRDHNGLIRAGAVVETSLGIRVDPENFLAWVFRVRRRDTEPGRDA